MKTYKLIIPILITFLFLQNSFGEDCTYIDKKGSIKSVSSKDLVPEEYKSIVKCHEARVKPAATTSITNTTPHLVSEKRKSNTESEANYKDFHKTLGQELKSDTARISELASSLGTIHLEWDRDSEDLFGKSPERAIIDAANATSRFLKEGGFSSNVEDLETSWRVIILANINQKEGLDRILKENCHPGWTSPPGRIYLVSDRISGSCGDIKFTKKESDEYLSEVTLHEFGHVVEFYLTKKKMNSNRGVAEGFATWFAIKSAKYSSVSRPAKLLAERNTLAKQYGFDKKFDGSAEAYASSSVIFSLLENTGGISAIASFYKNYNGDPIATLKNEYGWSEEEIMKRLIKTIK